MAPLGVVVDKIEAGKGVRVLFSDYDIIGDQTHCVLFTSEKFLKEKPEAAKQLTEGIAKAADWAKEHPKEAKELTAKILKDKGGNPDLAKYWKGFGVRDHALLADGDAQFWIDWLVRMGRLMKVSSNHLISIRTSSILIRNEELWWKGNVWAIAI